MSAVIPFIRWGVVKASPHIDRIVKRVSRALNDYVEASVHNRVSDQQLRRARSDMKRCDRLLHVPHAKRRGRRNAHAA